MSQVDEDPFAAPLDRSSTPGFVAILEDISGRKRFERERAAGQLRAAFHAHLAEITDEDIDNLFRS